MGSLSPSDKTITSSSGLFEIELTIWTFRTFNISFGADKNEGES
jgi:hypothetical protein